MKCNDCGKKKDYGYKDLCRKCYNKKWKQENREHYNAYMRKLYNKDPVTAK